MNSAGPAAHQAAQHVAAAACIPEPKLALAACACIMSAVLSCPAEGDGEASSLTCLALTDQ